MGRRAPCSAPFWRSSSGSAWPAAARHCWNCDGRTAEMCGIVGYVGKREAVPILLDGLARLEYRGYDSAGVAVLNGAGVETRKLAGRIAGLRELLTRKPLHGRCGIGH